MPHRNVVVDPEHYLDDLKARMEKHGVSQNELAAAIDRYPSQLSRMFSAGAFPQRDTILRIEQAMLELVKAKRKRRARTASDRA